MQSIAKATNPTLHPTAGRPDSTGLELLERAPESSKSLDPERVRAKWAVRAEQVPEGPGWVHEVEHPGQRILAHVNTRGDAVHLRGVQREPSGPDGERDWTGQLPELATALAVPALAGCIVDGVVSALGPDGRSARARLEQALAAGRSDELVLFAFDLLAADGRDLRRSPLPERKRALRNRLEGLDARLRFGEHALGAGAKVFDRACELGLEGVISKRVDSIYLDSDLDSDPGPNGAASSPARSAWVGVECARRLNLVVGGFTAPHGSRRHLGALLLGSYDAQGRLIYRGKCGSGFCEDSLAQLRPRLELLRQGLPAFFDPPVGSQARGVSWVRPELGVEVEYGELTDKGKLRHARFKGLRQANPAPDASAEQPASEPQPAAGLTMVPLSGADRPVFPALGLCKRDLADYTVAVAELMLPHVRHRALTLVRCPDGVRGEPDEQLVDRQADEGRFAGRTEAELPEGVALEGVIGREGVELSCPSIADALGLLGLVELDALELRTWGSRTDKLDHPDRLVFALEPDPALEFGRVVEAAIELRDRLAEYGLASYVKTSGGRAGAGFDVGLDLVVPVQRRRAYAPVARFCRLFAERMVAAAPERYTVAHSQRPGRVFLNHHGNARQATMVAPYSVRARPDGVVSTPLGWDELHERLRPEDFTLTSVANRVATLARDPWARFFELRQWITKASFRRIGINPDQRGLPPEPMIHGGC